MSTFTIPGQFVQSKHLLEVYKTDEENFVQYEPQTSETEEEPEEEEEEPEEEEEETEEEEEDTEEDPLGFSLHQGEILETYYYQLLASSNWDMDYEGMANNGQITLNYEDTDLSQIYKGVRLLLRSEWEELNQNIKLTDLAEVFLGFITDEKFSTGITTLSLSGMTKLLEFKYKFTFTQMLRSRILEEVIKTAGLVPVVDPTGLDDQVIDYTNVSSSSSDDGGVYDGDIPADVSELAKKICKGKNGCLAKAKAIYAWELKNVTYDFYNNSKYRDPSVCLQNRDHINCCDTAHLTVALCRAVGLKANYVHGDGHVWTVVHCDGNRYMMDQTDESHTRPFNRVWKDMTGTEKESIGF